MNLQSLMQMLTSGGNPKTIVEQAINQNPQVRAMFTQMQNSGMTEEQFVRQLAKQNNIDIEPIINSFRNRRF